MRSSNTCQTQSQLKFNSSSASTQLNLKSNYWAWHYSTHLVFYFIKFSPKFSIMPDIAHRNPLISKVSGATWYTHWLDNILLFTASKSDLSYNCDGKMSKQDNIGKCQTIFVNTWQYCAIFNNIWLCLDVLYNIPTQRRVELVTWTISDNTGQYLIVLVNVLQY